jgi:hypothetical protein
MTKKGSFDWDKYMCTETYNKVIDGMGGSRLLIPTMFSPDQKLIYLKTYDVAFETDDAATLNGILNALYISLQHEARNINWSCEKLYLLEVDYRTIWRILDNLQALPDDYQGLENSLKEVVKMIGAGCSPS